MRIFRRWAMRKYKRQYCNTSVLVITRDGKILIESNQVPEETEIPRDENEATIKEVQEYLRMRS